MLRSTKATDDYQMTAKTLFGLEQVLADELNALGVKNIQIHNRAVSFTGNKRLMYEANLWCRTALRILKPIATFTVQDENELYNKIGEINWKDYMSVNNTLAVDGVVSNSSFTHSKYVALKTKDAIVDQFRNRYNKRPSVNTECPDLRINVFITKNDCTVSLDSSGISLHKRGYRKEVGSAPINEVLAAGLILLSGWEKDCCFIDTMCGSGTLLIEAALIANNIPPGYYQKEFGFQRWKDYDAELWKNVIENSLTKQTEFEHEITGTDISAEAIKIADENIRFAKLHKDITLKVCSMQQFDPPKQKGIMIINPPYGERLKQDDIITLYKTIGDTLKNKYAGYQSWIISSDLEALKFIGLKPSKKIKVFNGQLECRFYKFDIYEGSKKEKFNKPNNS